MLDFTSGPPEDLVLIGSAWGVSGVVLLLGIGVLSVLKDRGIFSA